MSNTETRDNNEVVTKAALEDNNKALIGEITNLLSPFTTNFSIMDNKVDKLKETVLAEKFSFDKTIKFIEEHLRTPYS